MKKTLLYLILCLLPLLLSAQQVNVDSLINALETKILTVDEQLQLYDKIAGYYTQSNATKSLLYGKEGLRLAEKEKNKRMIARNCVNIGAAFLISSYRDSSMIFLNRAVELSEEINDKETQAHALNNIGFVYYTQDKKEETLAYYLKSLALYESIGDKASTAKLMINISSLYATMNQNERSLHYLKAAHTTIELMDVENPILTTALYESWGGHYLRTGDYEKALENMLIALDLSRKNHMIRYEITTTQYLAGIYDDGFHDYINAEKYALECEKAAESTGNKALLMIAWNILAKVYVDAGKFEEGKNVALRIWQTDSTTVFSATNTAGILAHSYMYTNDKEKASYYFGKLDTLRVREAEKQLHDSMAEMEAKYETEKKEIRIVALEKDRKLYTGLGIAVLIAFISGMGLLFYRHRLSIQKRKMAEQQIIQLEQEAKLIAVRSALEAEKAEREIIARDLHDGVGAILSVVKNNMTIMQSYSLIETKEADYFHKALDGIDKSIVELRRVAHHIMPAILIEKGLFTALNDFCCSIPEAEFHPSKTERRIELEKELVLYRCAYELVNNAMRHAKASHIDVHLSMDEEMVYLSVVDNGCGFDPQTTPQGMGIKNLHARLAVFGGSMEILSEPGKGTEVSVELKK